MLLRYGVKVLVTPFILGGPGRSWVLPRIPDLPTFYRMVSRVGQRVFTGQRPSATSGGLFLFCKVKEGGLQLAGLHEGEDLAEAVEVGLVDQGVEAALQVRGRHLLPGVVEEGHELDIEGGGELR